MIASRRAHQSNGCLYFYVMFVIIIVILCGCRTSVGEKQCGKSLLRSHTNRQPTGRIFGGYEVGFLKYPWFVALQYDEQTLCGGVLIGPNVILTAAHCFAPFSGHGRKPEDAFTVKLGVYNQCKREQTQSVYKAIKVDIHEKYNDYKPYYDIALMTISGDTSNYSSICLPSKPLTDKEQELEGKIIGFGSMIDGGGPDAYPCEMREGRILMYDNATCIAMVRKHTSLRKEYAFTNAICAGYKTGGVDSCSGDSGGPLMTLDQTTNTWTTVGITSFGWGCGEKDAMGVYTDVSKYLDWIFEKSGITPYQPDRISTTEKPTANIASNALADQINSLFDQLMNSTKIPHEIVIRFKSKQRGS